MAQRIPLGKGLTAAGGASPSIRIRLADPPFIFVATGTFTGTVAIEQSMDTMPDPPQFAEVSGGSGVQDSAATWQTIVTAVDNVSPQEWRNPLYRIRANPALITSGSANVYMLEGVRSLKTQKTRPQKSRQTQTEKA